MTATATLSILDRTGDTRIEWNPRNDDEVKVAEEAFNKAVKTLKMLAYRVKAGGGAGEQIKTFDRWAERIICKPQTVGG
jgi:hypothetical protein